MEVHSGQFSVHNTEAKGGERGSVEIQAWGQCSTGWRNKPEQMFQFCSKFGRVFSEGAVCYGQGKDSFRNKAAQAGVKPVGLIFIGIVTGTGDDLRRNQRR